MITFTVQNINLLGVKDMIEFANSNSIHLKIGILINPDYLHFNVLPINTKKKALEKLLDVEKEKLKHVTNFESLVSQLKLGIVDQDLNKINAFKSIISKRDSYRKIQMKNFVPELAEDLRNY